MRPSSPWSHEVGLLRRLHDLEQHLFDLLMSQRVFRHRYEIAVQAELHTRASHEMNVSAHHLNVLAAVFLPLVTLTGIFGMNLESGIIKALGDQVAFWTVLGAGMLIGIVLYASLGRRPSSRRPAGRRPAA